MFEKYIHLFSHLHTDKSPSRWTELTVYQAPHKPLLLLTIIDLIANKLIQTNFIEINANIIDTFTLYWTKIFGRTRVSSVILPFYHLKSDAFWHLLPAPGMEQVLKEVKAIRTFSQMRRLVLGAKFDDALFNFLLNGENREILRNLLIETYFDKEAHPQLLHTGQIVTESFEYSNTLLKRTEAKFKLREAPEVDTQYQTDSRSVAFRRLVVDAYDYTCALCRVRVVTPEGHSAVVAAHIVPWSISHNDDPRNGMALCGLHHWTFDEGLIGIDHQYHIILSPLIPLNENGTETVVSLKGHEIKLPVSTLLRPAKEALSWHYKNIFRTDGFKPLLAMYN